MAKKEQTPLQKYLSKKHPVFKRGSADCCAFVGQWVNTLIGENTLTFQAMTYGEAVRSLRAKPIKEQVEDMILPLKWKSASKPHNGDIVLFECEAALEGIAIGVFSDGAAITRIEDGDLFVQSEPKITNIWTYSRSQ